MSAFNDSSASYSFIEHPDNAYMCLVMKGDAYIKGALVVAQSIRDTDTANDIVCMVTPDVSVEGRQCLYSRFDYVIEVPYLEYDTNTLMSDKMEKMYGSWKNVSYTKWNVLNMTQYKKVIFMDADTVVLKNIDHLFDLRTPAGTFSSSQAKPFVMHGVHNPYARYSHGHQIRQADIEIGLSLFVCIGTTIILEPNQKYFNEYVDMMSNNQDFDYGKCINGPDEQSLCLFYHRKNIQWTQISQVYNMIPWKKKKWMPRQKNHTPPPYVLHYVGVKPWDLVRTKWPELSGWWKVYDKLLCYCPELNDMHKCKESSLSE